MRYAILAALTALSLTTAASYAEAPHSDLSSYPALPSPSEAELAAARQLDLDDYPWVQSPNVVDFLYAYPRRALRERVSGTVELNCLVAEDHRVACRVVSERPSIYDFGEAAIALSGKLRMPPTLANGEPTAGGKLRWTVEFGSTNRTRTPGSAQS